MGGNANGVGNADCLPAMGPLKCTLEAWLPDANELMEYAGVSEG